MYRLTLRKRAFDCMTAPIQNHHISPLAKGQMPPITEAQNLGRPRGDQRPSLGNANISL